MQETIENKKPHRGDCQLQDRSHGRIVTQIGSTVKKIAEYVHFF
jgi:hypothetical protein